VKEELTVLTSPETYTIKPEDAWKRVKTRTTTPKFLAIVRELAKFREAHAQGKNIPRNRVFKDDAMIELASTKPQSLQDLGRSRLLLREARKGDIADGILSAIKAGINCPPAEMPKVNKSKDNQQVNPALADLLRVLLKSKTERSGVASKLIATASELDAIASGERDLPSLKGWRREVFGEDALRLCDGEIALSAKGSAIKIVKLQ